ncbi:hypothetical protein TorRG33x02_277770 [Trema orientale]|uniref:Uncharacterized protein n=1 Tax=Trema orientale TaxID=63057 RepID=A0A2P5CPJ7_TREOI|nr:hypothetical protein TorRG33x02_277770 [Trema orientale]
MAIQEGISIALHHKIRIDLVECDAIQHLDPNLYYFVIIKSILRIPSDLAVKFKKVKNSSEARASKQLRRLLSNSTSPSLATKQSSQTEMWVFQFKK